MPSLEPFASSLQGRRTTMELSGYSGSIFRPTWRFSSQRRSKVPQGVADVQTFSATAHRCSAVPCGRTEEGPLGPTSAPLFHLATSSSICRRLSPSPHLVPAWDMDAEEIPRLLLSPDSQVIGINRWIAHPYESANSSNEGSAIPSVQVGSLSSRRLPLGSKKYSSRPVKNPRPR